MFLQRAVKTKETRLDHRWLKRGLPDLANENSEHPIQFNLDFRERLMF